MKAKLNTISMGEVDATSVSKAAGTPKSRTKVDSHKAELTAVAKVVGKASAQVNAVNLDAEFECIKLHAKQAMVGRINMGCCRFHGHLVKV